VLFRRHLNEDELYTALDIFLYLSALAGVALVAISIRFRKSVNLVKLAAVSLFYGLLVACVTFIGYMELGFG
jgi:hypothetical protein